MSELDGIGRPVLGDVFRRLDGFGIAIRRGTDVSACCNSGHETAGEALAHGEAQVRSWDIMNGSDNA